jgi:hypothetical protein
MGNVNRALGNANYPQPPYMEHGLGYRTPWGFILSPGARVAAIVSSNGVQDLDEPPFDSQLVQTLGEALLLCREDMGDVVLVRGSHAENIAADGFLTNLKSGTKIIGLEDPTSGLAPTFTWTADETLALDDDDVTICGLNFQINGTDDIAAGITVTGDRCRIIDCDFNTGTGASLDCVLAITTSGDDLVVSGCRSRQTGGTTTSFIKITDGSGVLIENCDLQMIGSAAGTGVVDISAAAEMLRIRRCLLENHQAASTAAVSVADAAITGVFEDLRMVTLNDGTVTAQGVVFAGATPTVRLFNCLCVDEPLKNGALSPAAAT